MKKTIRFMPSLVLLTLISASVNCQVLNVPQDYETIQAAINAATNGDTVMVDTGRYYENINFRGKSITVASKYLLMKDTSFIRATIIDGSKPISADTASCAMFYSDGVDDDGALLEGFTLTGGKSSKIVYKTYILHEGGGILMSNSKATIRNNIIIANIAKEGGGGIASFFGNPKILNNVIMNNTASYAGGIVLNWSDGVIKNNVINTNTGTGKYGSGGTMIWYAPGNPILENNTIVGNKSSTTAGGLNCEGSDPVITNNIIWGNRQSSGKQIIKTKNMEYCNLEDSIDGEGNIYCFPLFGPGSFTLASGSPCIDAGNPHPDYNDIEDEASAGQAMIPSLGTVRNDIGAFGGAGALTMNNILVNDVYFSVQKIAFGTLNVGDTINTPVEVLNLGTAIISIDSIKFSDATLSFIRKNGLTTLNLLESDSISIVWIPDRAMELNDTLKIYYSFNTVDMVKYIVITGNAESTLTIINKNEDNHEILKISPNPFTTHCTIKYHVRSESMVDLDLFNINGDKVAELIHSKKINGDYQHEFYRNDLISGVYIIQFMADGEVLNRKIMIN